MTLPSHHTPGEIERPTEGRAVSRGLMGGGGVTLGVGAITASIGTLPVIGTFGVHPELLTRILLVGGVAAVVIGALIGRFRRPRDPHAGG